MKNFQATRSKIKNYLDALKERFSTTEWKELQPNQLCKEFGVSVILPQILKNEGYYHYEFKDGTPSIMLSQKINTANEVTIHNKLREYCNKSAKKNLLKKKKIKAKNVSQSTLNFNKNEKKVKVISVSVGLNFYNSIITECKKNGLTVSKWMFEKLGAGSNFAPLQEQNTTKELDLKKLRKAYYSNSAKKQNLKKRGRPVSNKLVNTPTQGTEIYNSKTVHTLESAETKIKSLETIMNLFNKGIINSDELQSLKIGILTK
jgi:hypothetical protein